MSIRVGSVFAGVFYVIFGLIWIAMTSSMSVGPGAMFSLVGVLVIAYGILAVGRHLVEIAAYVWVLVSVGVYPCGFAEVVILVVRQVLGLYAGCCHQ